MKKYIDDLRYVFKNGIHRKNRSGIDTIGVFGLMTEYDISNNFPLITTKKMFWKGIAYELLWILKGYTNIKYLNDHNVHIWDANAKCFYQKKLKEATEKFKEIQDVTPFYEMIEEGELGPIYGKQWRDFNGYDQISKIIHQIKNDPESRRIILSAWNPPQIDSMALPPCHVMSQFYVNKGELSCMTTMRSADMFLGVPFNIASYSLLTYILANICGLKPRKLVCSIGDAHIYVNHIEQVQEQVSRSPLDPPNLSINKNLTDIDHIKFEDFEINNYKSYPAIRADMAV